MYRIFVFVFCIVVTIYLLLQYYRLKKIVHTYKLLHARFLREAADFSISASNNVNPVLALVESVKAERLYSSIESIYGLHHSNPLHIDLTTIGPTVSEQKKKILNDVLEMYKAYHDNSDAYTNPLISISGSPIEDSNMDDLLPIIDNTEGQYGNSITTTPTPRII